MMDDIMGLNRRELLQSASAAALAAVTPMAAGTASADARSLVVYRADNEAGVAFAAAMRAQGLAVFALGDDVVRQWRDELQTLVVAQGYRLLGRTGYADWFVLRGLAAEHRIFPQHEQQPHSHSFDWVI